MFRVNVFKKNMTQTIIKHNKQGIPEIVSVSYKKINHVISVKTHGGIDLSEAFKIMRYGTLSPSTFSALTMSHKNPSATVIIFSTGNMTIMGCESFYAALYVLNFMKKKLDLRILSVKLTNIVAKFSTNEYAKADVQKIYQNNQSNSACNIDIFPSCSYTIPNTKIKGNFFNSGKVIIAGCTSDDELEKSLKKLVDVIHANNNNIIKINSY